MNSVNWYTLYRILDYLLKEVLSGKPFAPKDLRAFIPAKLFINTFIYKHRRLRANIE
jgi:hypothetical protein